MLEPITEGWPLWPLVSSHPLPRLHVLSDLHLETGPYEIAPDLDFEILVVAGDVGSPDLAVPRLAKVGKQVVYGLGNHETLTSVFQYQGPASARQMDSRPTF